MRGRERLRDSICCFILQVLAIVGPRLGQSPEPRAQNSFQFSHMAGTRVPKPSLAVPLNVILGKAELGLGPRHPDTSCGYPKWQCSCFTKLSLLVLHFDRLSEQCEFQVMPCVTQC